ncbi:hypothetical protein [Pseudonocardia sp. ICBG601]|nr:hypothetical protein [Pseudonocardia sp. ICBG601]
MPAPERLSCCSGPAEFLLPPGCCAPAPARLLRSGSRSAEFPPPG